MTFKIKAGAFVNWLMHKLANRSVKIIRGVPLLKGQCCQLFALTWDKLIRKTSKVAF